MKKYTTVSGTVIILDEANMRFQRIKKDPNDNIFTQGMPTDSWIEYDDAIISGLNESLHFHFARPVAGYDWYRSAYVTEIEEITDEV